MATTPGQNALSIRAGHLALKQIQQEGLKAETIGIIPAAAGGPKALGLTGLDQAVFGWLASSPRTRELIGASIGGWRMACAMQNDPHQAFARLAECYTDTQFSLTDRHLVTRQTEAMLMEILGPEGLPPLLTHPCYRLTLLLSECHGLLRQETPAALALGLARVITLNTLSRSLLRHAFTRVICHDPRSALPFLPHDAIPTTTLPLTTDTLLPALLGSAAIPGVILAPQLPSAPSAVMRDGGLIDYHLDLPFADTPDLTLYPHFGERIIPGWFDKMLPWRRPSRLQQAKTIVIAPSRDYLARLPQGKLPSRGDFKTFARNDTLRQQYWRQATAESQRLGDIFLELVESGRIAQAVKPLQTDQ